MRLLHYVLACLSQLAVISNAAVPKTLEVILVTDEALFNAYQTKNPGQSNADVVVQVTEVVKQLQQSLVSNYDQLGTDVVILDVHIIKDEASNQPKSDPWKSSLKTLKAGTVNASDLLPAFNEWRKGQYTTCKKGKRADAKCQAWLTHDLAHLISGLDFVGSTIGLAYMASVCQPAGNQAGVVEYKGTGDPSTKQAGSTLTHEIGHNLGLPHYTEDKNCTNSCSTRTCIMAASSGVVPSNQWSSCSVDKYGKLQDLPCTNNVPDPDIVWGDGDCGNGIVEKDEECDCGNKRNITATCNANCCDFLNCKLKPGAKCDKSSGKCCNDQCAFREIGDVCRPAASDCDLNEVCTGLHATCPRDVFKRPFETCNLSGKPGTCSNGLCQTGEDRCKAIFNSPDAYYDKTCYNKDTECGDLLCAGSHKLDPSVVEMVGKCFKRKPTPEMSSPTVLDGTPCGDGGFCSDGTCTTTKASEITQCPGSSDADGGNFLECNGHGTCNSEGNCHCECGYAPPHCLYHGEGGSVDSATTCPSDNKLVLILTLILVLVVVPVILYFILRWYLMKHNYINDKQGCFKGFLDAMGMNTKNSASNYQTTDTVGSPPTTASGAAGLRAEGNHAVTDQPIDQFEWPEDPLPPSSAPVGVAQDYPTEWGSDPTPQNPFGGGQAAAPVPPPADYNSGGYSGNSPRLPPTDYPRY